MIRRAFEGEESTLNIVRNFVKFLGLEGAALTGQSLSEVSNAQCAGGLVYSTIQHRSNKRREDDITESALSGGPRSSTRSPNILAAS